MSREQEILDAFVRFQRALISNDSQELELLLSPGYRGYSLKGELEGRSAVLAAWAPGGIAMDEFSYDDLRIEVRGDVGILTGNGFVAGEFMGDPWEHHLHFCDIYLKGPGGWQLHISHSTEVER